MKNNVLVLLSTYNGEKYLVELIESLIKQENVNVNILVRDDGSSDNTINLIKECQKKYKNIEMYEGNNIGYAKSFWNLINKCSEYDYYAFCDQDDFWLPQKLCKAIKNIEDNREYDEQPILYTSNVIATDKNLVKIEREFFNGRILNKYETFQKSILPGCTFVFDYNAIKVLKKYDGYMESHDWLTYMIIRSFGKVIYDDKSYIYYRVHDYNTIGIESKFGKLKKKISRFFEENKNTRSNQAKDFYKNFGDMLDDDMKEQIEMLAFYKENYKLKIKLFFNKKFKGFIFRVYILMNKV